MELAGFCCNYVRLRYHRHGERQFGRFAYVSRFTSFENRINYARYDINAPCHPFYPYPWAGVGCLKTIRVDRTQKKRNLRVSEVCGQEIRLCRAVRTLTVYLESWNTRLPLSVLNRCGYNRQYLKRANCFVVDWFESNTVKLRIFTLVWWNECHVNVVKL